MVTAANRKPLEHYLSLQYPFVAHADPDGGYVIVYPDLPGCLSQAETLDEIPTMAEDARAGWIETEYEEGRNIPEPSHQEYSGKFNVRIPKSLHRSLADAAAQDGVSLNQYVVMLLSSGNTYMQIERQSRHLATMAFNWKDSSDGSYHFLDSPVESMAQRRGYSASLLEAVAA